MKKQIPPAAWIILALHLSATAALLIFGYGVQRPAVYRQEFPFSITYTYQGEQKTISEVFVAEHRPAAKYLGDKPLRWFGYIQGQDLRRPDFIRVVEDEHIILSINLNLEPGWLMGDGACDGGICAPTVMGIRRADGLRIQDPPALEALGFRLDGWVYPQPIQNRFFFGGISLSSEAVFYTSAIAIAALLLNLTFVERADTKQHRFGFIMNLLVIVFSFPVVMIVSTFSEILGETSALQQVLYLTPALTLTGISASLVLRRRGYGLSGFLIQFVGPAVFALAMLTGQY